MATERIYMVSGMHCESCARKIESALSDYGGMAAIDFPSATLRLRGSAATLEQLNDRLSRLGAYTLSSAIVSGAEKPETGKLRQYYPLLLIAAYLGLGSLANAHTVMDWMRSFMAGFFLVFSFFKLLNIRAFADAYAMYDLIAGRWKIYGMIYPCLELCLGFAYLFAWQIRPVLWATLALMTLGGIGVLRSMRRRQTIRCACLGTVLNVPVSTVTLIEDFGMAAMAAAMLAI